MKVLVCGDRNWADIELIQHELLSFESNVEVVQGGAKGADSLAETVCKMLNIPCTTYPAQWDKYGRAAGPIRNQQMLDTEKPDLVLAFHDNIESSKGTKDMIKRATKFGITVKLMAHGEP